MKANDKEIIEKCDVCVQCIKEIGALLHKPSELTTKTNHDLHKIINLISLMKQTGLYNETPELDKLHENTNAILMLINQIEAGDFVIKGNKVLQKAYNHISGL